MLVARQGRATACHYSTLCPSSRAPPGRTQRRRTPPTVDFALGCEVSEKGDRALKQKYANFGAYYYGGKFEQDFGTKALRVLVLVRRSRALPVRASSGG